MILINNKEFSKLRFLDIEKFLCDYDEDENFFVEFKMLYGLFILINIW